MTRAAVTLPYSSDIFDHWRLNEVGGYIGDQRGRPVFRFTSREQFDQYMRLNANRGQFEKNLKERASS